MPSQELERARLFIQRYGKSGSLSPADLQISELSQQEAEIWYASFKAKYPTLFLICLVKVNTSRVDPTGVSRASKRAVKATLKGKGVE